jgi:hypothetical protein
MISICVCYDNLPLMICLAPYFTMAWVCYRQGLDGYYRFRGCICFLSNRVNCNQVFGLCMHDVYETAFLIEDRYRYNTHHRASKQIRVAAWLEIAGESRCSKTVLYCPANSSTGNLNLMAWEEDLSLWTCVERCIAAQLDFTWVCFIIHTNFCKWNHNYEFNKLLGLAFGDLGPHLNFKFFHCPRIHRAFSLCTFTYWSCKFKI